MSAVAASSLPPPTGADTVFDWPGRYGRLQARLYRGAPARRGDVLVVFFHPGGFVMDDPASADHCLRQLATLARVNVLAPSYALAPEHPFPAAVEDAHTVLGLVVKHRSKLGWWGTHLFVGGVEAGGNLAAVSALVCRDRQGPRLSGQILVMPMLDASLHCESMLHAADQPGAGAVAQQVEHGYRCYLPRAADRLHPYASPLLASRLAGLPPALVLYAEGDPLSDEARAYADKLGAAGVPVRTAVLPPTELGSPEKRCDATAEAPGMSAVVAFLAPYVDGSLAPTTCGSGRDCPAPADPPPKPIPDSNPTEPDRSPT